MDSGAKHAEQHSHGPESSPVAAVFLVPGATSCKEFRNQSINIKGLCSSPVRETEFILSMAKTCWLTGVDME
jgi:hypothetical protein